MSDVQLTAKVRTKRTAAFLATGVSFMTTNRRSGEMKFKPQFEYIVEMVKQIKPHPLA